MAYHLACPLSCRKICYCTFFGGGGGGAGESRRWAAETSLQQQQIATAWAAIVRSAASSPHVLPFEEGNTVDVVVPSLVKDVKKSKRKAAAPAPARENGEKRRSLSVKKAFRGAKIRFSSTPGGAAGAAPGGGGAKTPSGGASSKAVALKVRHLAGAKSNLLGVNGSSVRTDEGAAPAALSSKHGTKSGPRDDAAGQRFFAGGVCGLCSSADVSGRKREEKMIACHGCDNQYHKKCVKQWAQCRDLFDWSSWRCNCCRICEVCRQNGDPGKLMFCKRCDGALHTYCQQPALKHVAKGPYLCPKHTVCHSCSSNVPGSGVSSRWFMCYTTCDACGRLFAKDKYCPVCLKVYRDSETTPMVRCDSCEHWVHSECDGISDEKFDQFQKDDNLRYECAACRGECPKVNSVEDAVRELWRRRDEDDAERKSKQGLVPQDVVDYYPSSDDEKQAPSGGPLEDNVAETASMQRNSFKKPRRKWIQKPQRKGEPKQKLLSSVALHN